MLGTWRQFASACCTPIGRCISCICPCKHCSSCEDLPEETPLGDKETALETIGMCARLVGGLGYVDKESWGKYDPPLNAEGWQAVEQVCETSGSANRIQAALYASRQFPGVFILAYRGTASLEGLKQDVSLYAPLPGTPMRKAIKEAAAFFRFCNDKYGGDGVQFYVTGVSLGGYLAEVVASRFDVQGAAFNSPGPWLAGKINCVNHVAGDCRPNFEIHLSYDDPIALLFPKPQNSTHIGIPVWHDGKIHRVCPPYVKDQAEYAGLSPNTLPAPGPGVVEQFVEIMEMYASDSESGSDDSESEKLTSRSH